MSYAPRRGAPVVVAGAGCPAPVRVVRPLLLAALVLGFSVLAAAEDDAAVETRLADAVRYLSSEDLQGRGAGTAGLDLAAQYIAGQFADSRLKTDLFAGTPMQAFTVAMSTEIGPDNQLALVGPDGQDGKPPERIELKRDDDFSPLAVSGTGPFDLPLAFAGYGITVEGGGYDDYGGLDVKGRMVLLLRHEPQQDNPGSIFNGTEDSDHASLQRKLRNAAEHGAAGVILCTDQVEIDKTVARRGRRWLETLDRLAAALAECKKVQTPTIDQLETHRKQIDPLMRLVEAAGERLQAAYDPLSPFVPGKADEQTAGFPVIHCRRAVMARLLRTALGVDLADLEKRIDEGPTPQSRDVPGWRAVGQTRVERQTAEVRNVLAVLEGEGPLAEETIVVGAHYDHLGLGREKDGRQEVYPGADDNASGVAALIEIARCLAGRAEKLHRRVAFVAFAAEERGLLGSAHYVDHPPFPLDKTVAMVNLDMVGRLRDEGVTVTGTGTAKVFEDLLDQANGRAGLKLTKRSSGFGASDHAMFHRRQIPAMHFFTGIHEDLHRPSDTAEKINVPGMRQVVGLVADVVVALANAQSRPEFVAAGPGREGRGP